VGERTILVGRGAKDNDALVTKVARPHDVWLHAKGRTGAHVVVPLSKEESIPTELLVDAAHLAAHFSDARGETVVEVQWTPRKYVRKPKGAAPGAVIVDREKVLVLRVDPARLQELLAKREE
jgi:predicted ribosome quality control (RQC) complex YloA/Tae2 family protein